MSRSAATLCNCILCNHNLQLQMLQQSASTMQQCAATMLQSVLHLALSFCNAESAYNTSKCSLAGTSLCVNSLHHCSISILQLQQFGQQIETSQSNVYHTTAAAHWSCTLDQHIGEGQPIGAKESFLQ